MNLIIPQFGPSLILNNSLEKESPYLNFGKIRDKKETGFNYELFKGNEYLIKYNIDHNIILNLLIKNKINRKRNKSLFLKVSNHEDLQNYEIILENVTGDGNCFYRIISHFLFGMQDY